MERHQNNLDGHFTFHSLKNLKLPCNCPVVYNFAWVNCTIWRTVSSINPLLGWVRSQAGGGGGRVATAVPQTMGTVRTLPVARGAEHVDIICSYFCLKYKQNVRKVVISK